MYYIIYKVTNQITGKFYIGAHKTKNLDDGYMGSGKYLKRAIEKHGIENFSKEILFVFDNQEEMYEKEAELVNEDFLAEANTYNLKVGGFGGFDYINKEGKCFGGREGQRILGKKGNAAVQLRRARDPVFAQIQNDLLKKVASLGGKSSSKFTGKTHTSETKEKIRQKAKERIGAKNSQFGKKWIYNPELKESKRIMKTEPTPDGWFDGRKMFK